MTTASDLSVPPQCSWRVEERSFESWDGTRLFFRTWRQRSSPRRALLLFHGGHEHSGRFEDLVERLDLREFAVYAWDARGHGRSPGERGYAPHFHHFVRDADAFVKFVGKDSGIPPEETVVLGHSVGSVLVAAWLHDYAPAIRGAVLGSPAFRVKLYVPFALPLLRLLGWLKPKAFIRSYVRPADSGRSVELHVCPDCGVSVYFYTERRPSLIGVHGGCFADPDCPAPDFVLWTEHKQHWLTLPDADHVFAAQAP